MNKQLAIDAIYFIWFDSGPIWDKYKEIYGYNFLNTEYYHLARREAIQDKEFQDLPGESILEKLLTYLGLWGKYVADGRPTFAMFREWFSLEMNNYEH